MCDVVDGGTDAGLRTFASGLFLVPDGVTSRLVVVLVIIVVLLLVLLDVLVVDVNYDNRDTRTGYLVILPVFLLVFLKHLIAHAVYVQILVALLTISHLELGLLLIQPEALVVRQLLHRPANLLLAQVESEFLADFLAISLFGLCLYNRGDVRRPVLVHVRARCGRPFFLDLLTRNL